MKGYNYLKMLTLKTNCNCFLKHCKFFSSVSKLAESSWDKTKEESQTACPASAYITKHDIYCRGELLHMIQMSDIFQDSKTFVDKKMKFSPVQTINNFKRLKNKSVIKTVDIKQFLDENFEEANELEVFEPPDWVPYPSMHKRILDAKLRNWASELNSIWKHLSRKVTADVKNDPDKYSIIAIPHGFIIPGGRFREIYYWDTYWIVSGLLLCDMMDTARGVIDNLMFLVNEVGHVPNGGRVYYELRSQPPMLTQMVQSYYKYTHDFKYIAVHIDILDKEMEYWLKNRSVEVVKHGIHYRLFRYFADDKGPRPESYREDIHSAVMASSEEEKEERYTAIKSAAESGWDFSTRWFILDGENKGNLSNMLTQSIVPVDLNAIMHKNFRLLHNWYKRLKNEEKTRKYYLLSTEILTAIENVLWDEEDGMWFDYDIKNDIPRDFFYMSNFVPLWTKSYTFHPKKITQCVQSYISMYNLNRYTGGSPTSTEYSGEQWDFPNAWPPLQAFLIQGLDRIGTTEASEIAFFFADKYIHSNYKGFKDLGVMFEKYDSLLIGRTGDGGEYDAQEGFGWTNGVVFEFLERWGHRLRAYDTKFAPRIVRDEPRYVL